MCSIRVSSDITRKYMTGLLRLARDKLSSLVSPIVSLASFSSPVLYLRVMSELTRIKHFFLLRQALSLSYKKLTRLERPARDKHSSLFDPFRNLQRKKFCKIGPKNGAETCNNRNVNKRFVIKKNLRQQDKL